MLADPVDLVVAGQPAMPFADKAEYRIRVARLDADDHQADGERLAHWSIPSSSNGNIGRRRFAKFSAVMSARVTPGVFTRPECEAFLHEHTLRIERL